MSRFDNVHELSADIVVNQLIQNMRKESTINESDLIDAFKRISNNNLRKSGNYNSVDLTDDDNNKKRNSKNKRNSKHDN